MKDIKYKVARIVVKVCGTKTDKKELKRAEQKIVEAQRKLEFAQQNRICNCIPDIPNGESYTEQGGIIIGCEYHSEEDTESICDKCKNRNDCILKIACENANDNLQAQINNTRSFVFGVCKEYFKRR